MTDQSRRAALRSAGTAGAVAAAVATGLLKPTDVLAAWNKAAFEAKSLSDAMKSLGISDAAESKDVTVKAPTIAENGAVVPIEISSKIPGTKSISVFIDKNPFPYTGTFDVSKGALPFIALRVKMGESSHIRAVVDAGGKFYTAAAEVKVTIGGCGG